MEPLRKAELLFPFLIIHHSENAARLKQGLKEHLQTFPEPQSVHTTTQQFEVLQLLSAVFERLTMTNMAAKHDLSAMAGLY